ncbi:MAG: glycosyltransferase family 4 protein [Verrucomicrobia bacterium]|nr:glycosyltransferase family 4 protein [Verrucomicrobiota bacterium]
MSTVAPVPKRILMTADTVGGVWSYALELAAALQPYGTEIALVTMGAPLARDQRRDLKRLNHIEVFETGYRLEWMDDPWHDVDAAGEQLLEIERTLTPDVVHLNGYAHGALPWRTPVLMVAHSCVVSWWQAVHHLAPPSKYDEYKRRVVAGLRGAECVVAITGAMLASLKENYGFSGRSRVISNGSQARSLSAGGKEPFILGAGRVWDEAKNFSLLDAVAPRLKWPVYVAGDCRHPNGSPKNFVNLNLLGPLPSHTLAGQMSRASIYALPARYEPFGLSILEAALCGCALVLGDIPSLRELWNHSAVFISPEDAQGLEKALLELIASPEQLQAMGCRARQRALGYSATAMAGAYLETYAELISSSARKEVAQ